MIPLEDILSMTVKDYFRLMNHRVGNQSSHFGVPTVKNPCDWWCYQELIWQMHPDVIIEIGTHAGGSALAMAHLLDNIGNGAVVSVDINHDKVPDIVRQHPRIRLITDEAVHAALLVEKMIWGKGRVMVIEDSAHIYLHTLSVLNAYHHMVTPGHYFIVEDSIVENGYDIGLGYEGGPYRAIQSFMQHNTQFEIDREREGFGITNNPKGFLRKKIR